MTDSIAEIVKRACAAETNAWGYGIWSHHITKVVEHCRRLAPVFKADPEVVHLAALLHDYAPIKDSTLYAEHHVHSPLEAEKVLKQFGYPAETIEAVKHAIAAHRGSVKVERQSPEAECLASADAIAHFESVPSLLYLVYVTRKMDIDEGAAWVRAKLERSWAKLNPQMQELAKEQYASALKTLGTAPKTNGKPAIVCLCGSTRFGEAFQQANLRETLAGRIVLSTGSNSKSDTELLATGELTEEAKANLDGLHRHKIDLADEVLILNVGGYIGKSTRSEIEYAELKGKAIRYLEPIPATKA